MASYLNTKPKWFRFALATGLRQSNVTRLEWSQIDMQRHVALIHADQAKARKAIAVPLNDDAIAAIRRQIGKHHTRVFTFARKPVKQVNTHAFQHALRRAGIADFRWHDLRHTWASWHVQAGTSLYELQAEMVRRYAHFSPEEHLLKAAARVSLSAETGTKMATAPDDHSKAASRKSR